MGVFLEYKGKKPGVRQFCSIFGNWWPQFLFLAEWMWVEPTQTSGWAAGDVRAVEPGEKTETLPDWHIRFCQSRQESGPGGLSPPPSPICHFISFFKAGPVFPFLQESAQWNRPTFQKHAVRRNVVSCGSLEMQIQYLLWNAQRNTHNKVSCKCVVRVRPMHG